MADGKPTIDISKNGPLLVKGLKKLADADGNPIPMEKDIIALCRCGASENKPFCDGTHKDIGFAGEVAPAAGASAAEEGAQETAEGEISFFEDGPLHIQGGVQLNNPDGAAPEDPSEYYLCRCGASQNKPYCDGSHKDLGFKG
jgi:CDGSH-type Zn-finger protein